MTKYSGRSDRRPVLGPADERRGPEFLRLRIRTSIGFRFHFGRRPIPGCLSRNRPARYSQSQLAACVEALRRMQLEASRLVPESLRLCSRSEEHTSELQSQFHLVCRLLLEKKKKN